MLLLALVGLMAWSGCTATEAWWRDRPGWGTRPAPRPRRPGPPASSSRPDGTAQAAPPTEASTSPDAFEEPGYCQLVLLSESSGDRAPPGLKDAVLAQAPAQSVGELLSVLYVPAGTTGTMHRYTLVYPSLIEAEAAREAVPDLDVAPVGETSGGPPDAVAGAMRFGVGLLYGTPRGHAQEAERLGLAETCLVRVLNAPDEPGKRRWAAGVLAGWVRGDRLGDHEKAAEHFRAAAKVVEPRSIEYMTAIYAWSRAAIQVGRPDLARETLTELVDRLRAHEGTEVFRRVQQTLEDLERKRGR